MMDFPSLPFRSIPSPDDSTNLVDLLDDLRTPQPGPVDPERCPVCRTLWAILSKELKAGHGLMAKAVVYAMHTHMVHGHPEDTRTAEQIPA